MVIKKRDKANTPEKSMNELVEKFAEGADGGSSDDETSKNAKRDYKAIRVPFNKYEFAQLEKGAKLTSRSKLNFIRYAMLKLVNEMEEGGGEQ